VSPWKRSLLVFTFAIAAAGASAEEPAQGAAAPPREAAAPAAPPVDAAPPPVRRVVLRGIKFGSDTAYIEPASAGVLELVAERMRENPQIRVRIKGHTDERASEAHNLELSLERAEAVKRILVGFGIAPDRLETVGLGEKEPIASNDTPEGRALNRRVELDVIQ
jgi:outer membrane protein OmpA-like peptidoglycan-associated protein